MRAVGGVGQWPGVLFRWVQTNQVLLAWSFGLSVVLFVGSLVILPVLVAAMRTDYFITPSRDDHTWLGRHPAARMTARVLKNTLGAVLLVAGLAMLVLPGQGILTMLVALSLLEFPGKRRLELRLIRQRLVLGPVNWIREKAGRPPLQIPDSSSK